MKAQNICLPTKRLLLEPMTDEETVALIKQSDSEEMRQAYSEMLEGCKQDPENKASQRVLEKCGFNNLTGNHRTHR